jgi:hypothetical protein
MNAEEVKVSQENCRGKFQQYYSNYLSDDKLQLMSFSC